MTVDPLDSLSQCRLACRKSPQNRHPGEGFLSDAEWSSVALAFDLTGRELSVAMLIFEGKTRYQIARALHCAPGTVRVYIDRLFAKLEVTDRLGMALRLVRLHRSLRSTADLPASHKSATCDEKNGG